MSRPLAVALDASAIPRELTGAGVYVLALAGALAERSDVALSVVTRRGDAARWQGIDGAHVVPIAPDGMAGRLVFGELALGRRVGRLGGCQLLHGPHYTMPRAATLPVVVTIHDLTLLEHPEWHERSKVLFFGQAIRHAARHASALICVSEQTAERLRERLAPSCPVVVAPHGVDHSRFRAVEATPGADAEIRAHLGVADRYLLFLGTLEPRKNVPLLIDAFEQLAANDEELTLVLAGKRGWGNAALDAALARATHRDRIRELGYVPGDLVPALLRGAAAVAYPSAEEGFGLPALEALACGAPLVTSAGSVMAQLAGDAAVLVTEANCEALAEALARARVGDDGRRARGIERAAAFTWDASASAHVVAYREALG